MINFGGFKPLGVEYFVTQPYNPREPIQHSGDVGGMYVFMRKAQSILAQHSHLDSLASGPLPFLSTHCLFADHPVQIAD